jgi:hypothetical protein
LPQRVSVRASINKLNEPIARTQQGGTIQIDIRVLHSLFRASLAVTGDESEDEQIDQFLKRNWQTPHVEGSSLLGDIFDDSDGSGRSESCMVCRGNREPACAVRMEALMEPQGGAYVEGFAIQVGSVWVVIPILVAVVLGLWKLGKIIWTAISN